MKTEYTFEEILGLKFQLQNLKAKLEFEILKGNFKQKTKVSELKEAIKVYDDVLKHQVGIGGTISDTKIVLEINKTSELIKQITSELSK